jgi:hypothetical protein
MIASIKRKLHSLWGETLMLNPNKMRGHEIAIFWILTLTTLFGGLIYLGYLGIIYRDRDSPTAGPKIREREAALTKEGQERSESVSRWARSQIFWRAGAMTVFLGLVAGASKPAVQPTRAVQAAAPIISDGCDLAGAIPNCKAIVADFVAKGEGHRRARAVALRPIALVQRVQRS